VAPLEEIPHEGYLRAILDELTARGPDFAGGRQLASIYLGGGTPSLWSTDCLASAIEAVCRFFGAPEPASLEITVEANPVDCTPERLAAWRAAGVNRLSIGVQSVDPSELVALGRDHRMGEGLGAVEVALAAGFTRLSADLILGAPGRGAAGEPLAGVTRLADLGAPHLSVYELTVEEGTPLHQRVARGEVVPETEDRLAELYIGAHELLTARGYQHYEVSSYGRPGARAVHNSLYWRGAEFLGLGCGAASFLRDAAGGGVRWSNHRSVGRYLAAAPGERRADSEVLSPGELAADRVWLGLRTSDGVEAAALDGHPRLVEWLCGQAGLAALEAGRIRPTLRGFLYSNRVIRRVLEEFRYPLEKSR
jgi:oxygen-independent coproporphyrinogen III oxidase